MIAALVVAFVLSGAAGLIYESIWARYLGLFVGHSAYAQIIVLVIFLGGMSVGAHLAGQRSSRLKVPLLWYAGIELVVGLMTFAFDDVFSAVTTFAYASIFPSTTGLVLTIVKWSLAGALILPQSILLGATFPLMSAGVIRLGDNRESPGRILGLLYFANSVGAAAGVLIAGFYLLQATGLPGTLMVAAFVNIGVALIVGFIARAHQSSQRAESGDQTPGAAPAAPQATPPVAAPFRPSALWRPLLIVSFGTAVASFVYEIAWIRMLSLVIGSATHSFELMLSAFILGLSLGALWIRRRADSLADPIRFLGVVQWIMGLAAVATLPFYVESFSWMRALHETVQTNDNGYRAFIVLRYGIALMIMLPATFCAGMTLPLLTRVLMRDGAGERAIGSVYAVNTLGSIAGVILAGLVLMPIVGLKHLLITGALVDIALGIWLVTRSSGGQPARAPARGILKWRPVGNVGLAIALAASAGFIVAVGLTAKFDLGKLSSGVYRHGYVGVASDYEFPFYKDGRTATVSLRRSADGFLTLATNGKPDASLGKAWLDTTSSADLQQLTHDLATQLLLPIITLAHSPQAENAAVIGFGSGMSSHILLGSQLMRQVVTIEIEPEMINASRGFRPANRRVFDDPRSTFAIDDAKAYFASAGRKFDLVLSEPSNPWVSGVSGLFTVEFYQRVKDQLSPRGVFGQWLHLYELNDGLATSVLAAIDAVFPSYEVFFTSNADVLVVAANHELPKPTWSVVTYPAIAEDLQRVVPLADEQMEALRLGGRSVLRPMIKARGAPNSDYFPVLDLGAERLRFLRENANGYTGLSEGRFDVVAALSERRAGFGQSTISATPGIPRSQARALGANLRAIRTLPDSVVSRMRKTEEIRIAAYRLDQLERMAAGGRAPTDWRRWIEHVIAGDADLHGGTAGVVDSAFFRTMRNFAARAGAPAEARASLDFLHGIGSWNWAEVVAASKILETSRDSVRWVPDVLLRNASVVANIKLGRFDAATSTLRTFAARTGDDIFRERLLSDYLTFANPLLRNKMGLVP